MTRPSSQLVMTVGRYALLRSRNGWKVKNTDNGECWWPSSLPAAMQIMYENVIADNRFNDKKQNGIDAMRQAIVRANEMFNDLLTPEKIEELNEIVREAGR